MLDPRTLVAVRALYPHAMLDALTEAEAIQVHRYLAAIDAADGDERAEWVRRLGVFLAGEVG